MARSGVEIRQIGFVDQRLPFRRMPDLDSTNYSSFQTTFPSTGSVDPTKSGLWSGRYYALHMHLRSVNSTLEKSRQAQYYCKIVFRPNVVEWCFAMSRFNMCGSSLACEQMRPSVFVAYKAMIFTCARWKNA